MNTTFTIEIKAPELAHALETLAIAIGCTVDKIGVGEPVKEAAQQVVSVTDKSLVLEAENVQANNEMPDMPIPTVVEIRAVAQEKGKTADGKAAIKKLLNKYESKSLSTVPEEKRAAFIKELEAI